MKSRAECEFEAGLLLGMFQQRGFSPKDTITVLVLLVAYMTERVSTDKRAARDLFVRSLDEVLGEPS